MITSFARLTLSEFESHVKKLDMSRADFAPRGVCLHHTYRPNADQWNGANWLGHLKSLRRHYAGLGWSRGPHLFLDPKGIYVYTFTPLNRRGTHAIAFNYSHWSIEMVGDFGGWPGEGGPIPEEQRGLSLHVSAILLRKIGTPASNASFVFHREDPDARKTCPGLHVDKPELLADLRDVMSGYAGVPVEVNGQAVPAFQSAGVTWVHARSFMGAIGGDLSMNAVKVLSLRAKGRNLTMAPGTYQIRDGYAYIPLRAITEKLGGHIDPTNRRISVRL